MTKIVDANVWVTEPEMYSDNAGIMDQSMEAAGWKEKGLHKNTGVTTYKDGNLAGADARIRLMDEAGVDVSVIQAIDIPNFGWKVSNEYVANLCKEYPDRFVGVGGFNPWIGETAVKQIEHCMQTLELKGFKVVPSTSGLAIDDKRLWRMYEKCEDLGGIMMVHTGWSGTFVRGKHGEVYMKHQDVNLLDEVCVDFPKLKVVAVHAGEHRYEDCVALMLKNQNLYANTSWWGFLQPLERNIKVLKVAKHFMVLDKLLWGSDNHDIRVDLPLQRSLSSEDKKLNVAPGLPEVTNEYMDNYLGGNAVKLYGI